MLKLKACGAMQEYLYKTRCWRTAPPSYAEKKTGAMFLKGEKSALCFSDFILLGYGDMKFGVWRHFELSDHVWGCSTVQAKTGKVLYA